MAKCKNCINLDRKGWCEKAIDSPEPNREMDCYYFQQMTNADRIRAMTDEELAEFLDKWELKDIDYSLTFCNMCKGEMYDCHKDCLMQWLKKEVDDG